MRSYSIYLLVLTLLYAGCDSSEPETVDSPPMPSPIIFNVLPDLFLNNVTNALGGEHFNAAMLRFDQVNINLGPVVALPFASLNTATIRTIPFESENNEWVWQDAFLYTGQPYQYELIATPTGTDVWDWKMLITGPDPISGIPLSSFILFSINAETDRKGSWSLFFNDRGASQFALSGRYDAPEATEWTFEFQVSTTYPAGSGDTIFFARSGDTITYIWNTLSPEQEHTMQWNVNNEAGSIISSLYNGGDKGCWDSDKANVPC